VTVTVRIPTVLRSYVDGATRVESDGTTVADVLVDLDQRFPGLRFRVVDERGHLRQHMKVFLGDESTDDLDTTIDEGVEMTLMQSLSGG
jgi:molybdopterin converting factor small subunit